VNLGPGTEPLEHFGVASSASEGHHDGAVRGGAQEQAADLVASGRLTPQILEVLDADRARVFGDARATNVVGALADRPDQLLGEVEGGVPNGLGRSTAGQAPQECGLAASGGAFQREGRAAWAAEGREDSRCELSGV
jgi:hypothetical protein